MAANRYPLIAREGWWLIGCMVLFALATMHFVGPGLSLPFWGLAAVLVFIFRDPFRDIPPSPTAIVSPVDGEVLVAEEVHDPYLDRDAKHLTIRMHPWGVYSVRSPVQGKALEPHHANAAVQATARGLPHGVWLQTDQGDDLVMVMNRGRLRNMPRCYVGFGERVGQGQRCGFVHLGAQVDLYLPATSRFGVKPGTFVRGGADVVATLIH